MSNPPYVAEHEVAELPAEVAAYEPRGALVSGPTGLEAIERPARATRREWLAPGGVARVRARAAPGRRDGRARARALGFAEAFVRDDLAGRARVLVARGRVAFADAWRDRRQLDVDAMLARFRDGPPRCATGRCRRSPAPSAQRFIEQAQLDFQDFAIVGDATGRSTTASSPCAST